MVVAFIMAQTDATIAEAATGLISRIIPEHASKFVVEPIPLDTDGEVFEIESRARLSCLGLDVEHRELCGAAASELD